MTPLHVVLAFAFAQSPVETPPADIRPPAQEAPAAPAPPSTSAEKPPLPAAPVIDYTARFDLPAYEGALGSIAAAYPDLLRVRTLGKSREGKDIWLAVVVDTTSGDPGKLPAVLVTTSLRQVAGGAVGRTLGPEAALFVLAQLLESARSDAALRERLTRTAVYFIPALDPDAAFPVPAPAPSDLHPELPPDPRRARLDGDFPARWTPSGREAAPAGPYPLSEPESRLFARFLVERANLSAVVVMSEAAGSGASGESSGTPSEPGSLEVFCLDVLDAAVVRPAPWTGAPRTGPVGNAPEGFHVAAALVRGLAEDLPRLQCAASKVERLRPDLWSVDLSVANEGRLGSAGTSARAPGASSVSLRTNGGRVVACAVRKAGAESFESLRPAKNLWLLGDLGGKESLAVRLVVQAEEGTAVEAVFEGPRGGRARAEVSLR